LDFFNSVLEANSFLGDRKSKSRTIVLTLAVDGAGAKDDGTTLAAAVLNLGEIEKGTIWTEGEFVKGAESGWISRIGITKASADAYKETVESISEYDKAIDRLRPKVDSIDALIGADTNQPDDLRIKMKTRLQQCVSPSKDIQEGAVSSLDKLISGLQDCKAPLQQELDKATDGKTKAGQRQFMPIAVKVTVAETDDGNAALRFVADVLDGAQSTIVSEIGEKIIPEKRAETAAKEEKLNKGVRDAEAALLKAQAALADALAKDPGPSEKQKEFLEKVVENAKADLAAAESLRGAQI